MSEADPVQPSPGSDDEASTAVEEQGMLDNEADQGASAEIDRSLAMPLRRVTTRDLDKISVDSSPRKSNRRSLFDDDEDGDIFKERAAKPGEIDLLSGPSKPRASAGKRASKGKKKKKSLFDDLADGDDGEDFFNIKKKSGKKKSIDLFGDEAPSDRKQRKKSSKNVQDMLTELMTGSAPGEEKREEEKSPEVDTMAKYEEMRKMFEFRDRRIWFSGPSELKSEIMRRFDRFEKLVDSLDFSETGNSDLSSPIPGIVLKESIQRLVSDLHDKDQILKEKDLLIDALQESVDSTFERDEIIKQQERKQAEIDEERKLTDAEESVCDELQRQIDELESELNGIRSALDQREREVREEHEQEQYKVAMLHYEEHEPLEQRIKAAKNEQVKHQIELSTLLADNSEKKGRIDVAAFEEVQRLKGEIPDMLRSAVERMRDGLGTLLDNAFNPLKEYPGDKIHTAMRNALQTVGKKVLASS